MFVAALGGAAVTMIPLFMLTLWMKSWMPNTVATFLGCALVAGVALLMILLHFAHTVLYGMALAVIGLPLLIVTNGFPRKVRR